MRLLRGRVISGRGIATGTLGELKPRLEQETGLTITDGSLNVILRRPVRLSESTALLLNGGKLRFWPAATAGHTVWIYRWVGQPRHVVELISDRHLRSAMQLRDGDPILIRLGSEHVESMPVGEFLAWAVRWAGRKDWYYTRGRYLRRVVRTSRKVVATRSGLLRAARKARDVGTRPVVWLRGRFRAAAAGDHESGGILPEGTDEPDGQSAE